MSVALAAISCRHANKALPNLIKIHGGKMEADSLGKGYQSVQVRVRVRVYVRTCASVNPRKIGDGGEGREGERERASVL